MMDEAWQKEGRHWAEVDIDDTSRLKESIVEMALVLDCRSSAYAINFPRIEEGSSCIRRPKFARFLDRRGRLIRLGNAVMHCGAYFERARRNTNGSYR